MSLPARSVAIALGMLMAAGGVALRLTTGNGWALVIMGLLIVGSVLIEGRYRGTRMTANDGADWQRTREREIDSESGEAVEVWFDPATGARCYRPLGAGSGEDLAR